MMRFILLFSFVWPVLFSLRGQPPARFEHFGPADGLPHRSITSVLQDRKGFIWFSTHDGVSRFDGQAFRTYKPGNSLAVSSNRCDKLTEDIHGTLWMLMNSREVVSLDPRTETLRSYTLESGAPFIADTLFCMPSGKVWLISSDHGCLCATGPEGEVSYLNVENGSLTDNTVHSVHEDSNGSSWILTGNGLVRLSPEPGGRQVFMQENTGNDPPRPFFCASENAGRIRFGTSGGRIMVYDRISGMFEAVETGVRSDVISICSVPDGRYTVLTSGDGFLLHDPRSGKLEHYHSGSTPTMNTNHMLSAHVDSRSSVWIETERSGVLRFDPEQGRVSHYESNFSEAHDAAFLPAFKIVEDSLGNVWIHPRQGGFSFYDRKADRLIPFYDPSTGNPRQASLMSDFFLDRQNILWLCTRMGGVEKVTFDNKDFRLHFADKTRQPYIGDEIRSIFEDRQGNLWLGCKDGITRLFDKEFGLIGHLCTDGTIGTGTPVHCMAYHIFQDSRGDIWIGTKGNGLIRATANGTHRYKLNHFRHRPDDIYSLSQDNVYVVFEDSRHRIWVGTHGGGLNLFDREKQLFVNHKNNLTNYPIGTNSRIRTLSEDRYGNILIGTTFGLVVFRGDFESPNRIVYSIFTSDPNNPLSLCANDVMSICRTESGETYLGTNGGGFCRIDGYGADNIPLTFVSYGAPDGLPSEIVHSMVEDRSHRLWLATESELVKFDPGNSRFETFGNVSRIMKDQYFSEAAGKITRNGDIFFGTTYGLFVFDPEKISESTYTPYLAFKKFNIYNKELVPEGNTDDLDLIRLRHNENYFSIEYTALDYITPENILYTYRLEGFDSQWIPNQRGHIVNYTNVPPGEYIFRIRSTNSSGQWTDNERSLSIVVQPSFWQMGVTKALYILLAAALLLIAFRLVFTFYRLRDKVRLETEQTEMRTRFFTDISHEIRTPLTLIVSPIEHILEDPALPEKTGDQLKTVLKNARRMLGMVNQILDFRKIQKYHLNVQQTAIGPYVGALCEDFIRLYNASELNLSFLDQSGGSTIWVDREYVDKLVYNLISNAVKNTPPGKEIRVKVTARGNEVLLEVRDEGVGMSKEVQNKLFTRFASYNTDKNKPSTGIGLSIVKEIVEKHHAQITVESEEGKGSCFTLFFKTGTAHFSPDKQVMFGSPEIAPDKTPEPEEASDLSSGSPFKETSHSQKESILVVEDDSDLRIFIRQMLENEYTVFEAENGENGYQAATQFSPDFILSDVMMPGTDGIEFLRRIRENAETSHIPFILLTAKADVANQIEGISSGADDYITKPFNVKLLKAKIKTIISQRRKLYGRLVSESPAQNGPKTGDEPGLTSMDEKFIRDIRQFVLDNMDNDQLTIDDLAATTSMSRRVFFNKLKSLTGLSPVEFVRETRIRQAAFLLETGQYRVKEVSYMVGISDIKYFTKYFKLYYGITPGKYAKED